MGIVASAMARPTSPAMRIGRRRSRSTQTPAGRVNRMNGSISKKPSIAASNGLTLSVMIAIAGIAIMLTWLPNRLIVEAVQSLTKSAWRQRPQAGRAGRRRVGDESRCVIDRRRRWLERGRRLGRATATRDPLGRTGRAADGCLLADCLTVVSRCRRPSSVRWRSRDASAILASQDTPLARRGPSAA